MAKVPQTAKSSYLHILEGNPNHKTKAELHRREKNEKALTVSADHIEPPAWLSTGAKKEFRRVRDLFKETTLLNEADIQTLAMYADLCMEYKACQTRLKKNGRSNDGKPSPDIRLKLQISQQIAKCAKDLGLNPAARASLAINMTDDKKDDDDDF